MTPTTLPLQRYLVALYENLRALDHGTVATYIPQLAQADPNGFGICIVTTDGYAYAVGDSDVPFTMQSVSKPAVYAAALADRGRDAVLRRVGVEPSGEAFNSISLDPQTGAPLNPMINAGAIATTGLVAGSSAPEQWSRIVDVVSALFGRPVEIDDEVYRSESETGFRNRAIAWMLKNFGVIEGDPMSVLENYFRQCSILVTCRDLAFMAATLANGGVHPRSARRAVAGEEVQSVLSIMATCGMYDYAGSWLYDVGLPAKSGVSGGLIAVMPGRFGLAVYSPRLDARGNSARGIAVCREISREFGLHAFGVSASPSLVVANVFSALEVPSRRVRSPATAPQLRELASRIRCYGLQGDVAFDGAEFVVRSLMQASAQCDSIILDMHRVSVLTDSAARLLHEVRRQFVAHGKALVFSRIRRRPAVEDALRHTLPEGDNGYLSFEDNDLALEWCEDRLLRSGSRTRARRRHTGRLCAARRHGRARTSRAREPDAPGRLSRWRDHHLGRRERRRSAVFHPRRRSERGALARRRLAPAPGHALKRYDLWRDGDARHGGAQRDGVCRHQRALLDLERRSARRDRARASAHQDRATSKSFARPRAEAPPGQCAHRSPGGVESLELRPFGGRSALGNPSSLVDNSSPVRV
jgi:glutaminase